MAGNVKRILIVDDNPSIHEDLKHVLNHSVIHSGEETRNLEQDLFGDPQEHKANSGINLISKPLMSYEIDDAYQGEEAIQKVVSAEKEGSPYALIFNDLNATLSNKTYNLIFFHIFKPNQVTNQIVKKIKSMCSEYKEKTPVIVFYSKNISETSKKTCSDITERMNHSINYDDLYRLLHTYNK